MIQPTIEYPGVKIWDNLIEDIFLSNLDYESDSYNFQFTNTGGKQKTWPGDRHKEYRFWGATLYNKHNFLRITDNLPDQIYDLYIYLTKNIIQDSLELIHCQINGQTLGLDGGIHRDNHYPNGKVLYPYTLMIFLNSKWDPSWGGEFQILENNTPTSKVMYNIDYVPGRVLYFDGNLYHRGLSPLKPYILRKSLVFKLSKHG